MIDQAELEPIVQRLLETLPAEFYGSVVVHVAPQGAPKVEVRHFMKLEPRPR